MKVLLLSHSPKNPDGGASRIYHILADGLSSRGHFIRAMHYEDFDPIKNPLFGRLIDRLVLPSYITFKSREVWREPFDVIMSSSGMAWPIFKKLKRNRNRPLFVSHIHGLSIYDHLASLSEYVLGRLKLSFSYRILSAPLTFFWERQAARYADLTVVQNDRDIDFLSRSQDNLSKILKIEPGVYQPLMNASLESEKRERRPNSILWFGSWTARKGIFAVPAAFDLILDDVPDATLTIGGVHLAEGDVRNYFSDRANSRIQILPKISIEKQVSCFREHEVFLFPSLSEGFGLSLLEAMAFGLAAVTTDTGVGGDALEHEKNALIVPKGSAIHLARAVTRLLKDRALMSSISNYGRLLAQSYSEDKMVDAYERAFLDGLRLVGGADV